MIAYTREIHLVAHANVNTMLHEMIKMYGRTTVVNAALKGGLTVGKREVIGTREDFIRLQEKLRCED